MPEVDNSVSLRDYVEALLAEQRHGLAVIAKEQEKAIGTLRAELDRLLQEVRESLDCSGRLETERIERLNDRLVYVKQTADEHIAQLRHEREIITNAQGEAIAKAEAATEKRFEAVNAFRAQLANQTGSFLPREVAETQFAELRRAVSELTEKVGKLA